jgi:two-component system sensor histidine kinase MprB
VSLRTRLTLAAAVAVALAVALASALAYVIVRDELRGQVDDALRTRAAIVSRVPLEVGELPGSEFFLRIPRGALGDPGTYVQLVNAQGQAARPPDGGLDLPIDAATREVAAGKRAAYFSEATVANTHVRVLTAPLEQGVAIQVVRSLEETDSALHRLGLLLLLVAAAGVVLATAAGILVTRTALRPVRRLSETAAEVTRTGDLTQRVEAGGRDELSRLAESFNAMLEALERSVASQRQLVADASHELRTPLTSLRTNVEVLALSNGLSEEERRRLMQDVIVQLEEMSVLVADVVDLARSGERTLQPEPVRLDLLVAGAIERTRRHAPDVVFETDLAGTLIEAVPSDVERAVGNLLDNAAKWSAPQGAVEVSVRSGEVTVRDHGRGIDEADLPHIFDRFYRAPSARGLPGSGLGLAIVRQVADAHGGEVSAEAAEGGGTRFRLRFPVLAVDETDEGPPPEEQDLSSSPGAAGPVDAEPGTAEPNGARVPAERPIGG